MKLNEQGSSAQTSGHSPQVKAYSVTVGLHGYLPNSQYFCETLTQARQCAKAEKESFLDYGAEDESIRVTGNLRTENCYDVERRNYQDEWESWQYIEIAELELTQEEYSKYLEYEY